MPKIFPAQFIPSLVQPNQQKRVKSQSETFKKREKLNKIKIPMKNMYICRRLTRLKHVQIKVG